VCHSKQVEPLMNSGILNSITRLHLVGYLSWVKTNLFKSAYLRYTLTIYTALFPVTLKFNKHCMCYSLTCSEQPTARQPTPCCYVSRYIYIRLSSQKYLSLTKSVVIRCMAILLLYISCSYSIIVYKVPTMFLLQPLWQAHFGFDSLLLQKTCQYLWEF
jgi:hypothetical protein